MQIYSFMIVKIKTRESDLIPIYLRFALASLTATTNIKEKKIDSSHNPSSIWIVIISIGIFASVCLRLYDKYVI